MTDKEKQERWENLIRLHDKIKENPYWLNFDQRFLKELVKDFRELNNNVWGVKDETNPYYVMLRATGHDFSCMLTNIQYWMEDNNYDEFESRRPNIILTMQTFLMNVHRMLDDREEIDDTVIGFTAAGKDLKTYVCEWFEDDNEYRALNLIRRSSIEGLRKWLSDRANLKYTCYTKEWAEECLKELDEGKTIIGKFWKIKEETTSNYENIQKR